MENNALEKMKQKGFWTSKEGLGGLAIIGLVVGGGLMVWDKVLPILIRLAENTLYLGGMIAVGATATVLVVTNLRNLSLGFRLLAKKFTSFFTHVFPIEVMEDLVNKFEKRLQTLGLRRSEIASVKQDLERELAQTEGEVSLAQEKLEVATKTGDEQDMIFQTRESERGQDSVRTLTAQVDKIDEVLGAVDEAGKNCQFTIMDLKGTLKKARRDLKAFSATTSALKSARSIIDGDPDERAMWEASLDTVNGVAAQALGEMDTFMRDTEGMRRDRKLMDGVYLQRAKKLAGTIAEKRTLMLGPVPERIGTSSEARETVPVGKTNGTGGRFDGLFDDTKK